MKATLKRQMTSDKDLQLIQDAVQAGLDKVASYTPNPASKWAAPAPATIEDALDRMANLLVTLNSGTAIP